MVDPAMLDEWCSFYDLDSIELDQINKLVELKGKEVLEIGCRTGKLALKLGEYRKLTAVDKDESLVEYCKKKNKKTSIEFKKAEPGSMSFADASFDVVLVQWNLSDANTMGSFLWDISRVLRPGGLLIIVGESGLGENEDLKNALYPRYKKLLRTQNHELRRQLERFFHNIDQQNILVPIVYPDLATASKWVIFELSPWTTVDQTAAKKELEKFVKSGRVVVNRGVMFLKVK